MFTFIEQAPLSNWSQQEIQVETSFTKDEFETIYLLCKEPLLKLRERKSNQQKHKRKKGGKENKVESNPLFLLQSSLSKYLHHMFESEDIFISIQADFF